MRRPSAAAASTYAGADPARAPQKTQMWNRRLMPESFRPRRRKLSGMSRRFHICVFCGARAGSAPAYVDAAAALGRRIGERNLGLVYGGARVGLMGALADAALAAGAPVLGVLPRSISRVEVA